MRLVLSLFATLSLVACSDDPDVGVFPTDSATDASEDSSADVADDGAADVDEEPSDDAEPDVVEDTPVIDVSEAFCECDDDCLPLGDGSLCNGTVCTFGVPGIRCEDVGDVSDVAPGDVSEDAEPDAVPDVVPDAELDATPDAEPDAPDLADLTVTYDTTGGFTGEGGRDIRLVDGHMWVDEPFITDCDADLTTDQLTRLIDAAAAVDWASMEVSYRPPDNPTCCCDQFVYTLTVTTENAGGGTDTRFIDWCDESIGSLLPFAIDTFIAHLNDVADEVYAPCE